MQQGQLTHWRHFWLQQLPEWWENWREWRQKPKRLSGVQFQACNTVANGYHDTLHNHCGGNLQGLSRLKHVRSYSEIWGRMQNISLRLLFSLTEKWWSFFFVYFFSRMRVHLPRASSATEWSVDKPPSRAWVDTVRHRPGTDPMSLLDVISFYNGSAVQYRSGSVFSGTQCTIILVTTQWANEITADIGIM